MTIYNEDCITVTRKLTESSIDVILTSPPYNTNVKAGKRRTLNTTKVAEGQYDYVRYDAFIDNIPNEEYIDNTVELFNTIETKLKDKGTILYNMSYGSENTECLWITIADIIRRTNFTVADCIIWKKKTAMPNSCSPNKLTRIVEYIFVFCKKDAKKTFYSNKQHISTRRNGQKMYESVTNFIEARNNDGSCRLNKATYSTELCVKLLKLYCPPNGTVYDPFNGTGTTGVACKQLGLQYIGAEISKAQCDYSRERIASIKYEYKEED